MKEGRFPTLVARLWVYQAFAAEAAMKEGRFPTLVTQTIGWPLRPFMPQ